MNSFTRTSPVLNLTSMYVISLFGTGYMHLMSIAIPTFHFLWFFMILPLYTTFFSVTCQLCFHVCYTGWNEYIVGLVPPDRFRYLTHRATWGYIRACPYRFYSAPFAQLHNFVHAMKLLVVLNMSNFDVGYLTLIVGLGFIMQCCNTSFRLSSWHMDFCPHYCQICFTLLLYPTTIISIFSAIMVSRLWE